MKSDVRRKVKLSNEDRLLVLCARLNLSTSQHIALHQILTTETLSWEMVLRQAIRQYLAGSLFHHLRHEDFRLSVPAWVMEELKQIYFRNGLRNRLLQSELQKALETLQMEGIPVMALKGAALLETVYPNNLLRPMADIDLLVPEEAADVAHARVCQLGYTPIGTEEEQEHTRAVHQHLPKLVDSQGLVKVEVHTHIVPRDSPLRFDISSFWDRSKPHYVAGVEVRVPAPEHMLMHLAVHFFLDRRFRSTGALRQLCDMAETARCYQHEIDWDLMAEEVHNYGLGGPVHCGLLLAHELLDAPVPGEFLRRITPETYTPASMDLFVRRRILDGKRVIASQLVKPQAPYTLRNTVRGILGRVTLGHSYLGRRYGEPDTASAPTRFYLRRIRDGLSLLSQYLREPQAIRQELLVDKWMHSVSSGGRQRPLSNHAHQQALGE